jgi:hypothetical protein
MEDKAVPAHCAPFTYPFAADFECQGAYTLAKDNDPAGQRTIGELCFSLRRARLTRKSD